MSYSVSYGVTNERTTGFSSYPDLYPDMIASVTHVLNAQVHDEPNMSTLLLLLLMYHLVVLFPISVAFFCVSLHPDLYPALIASMSHVLYVQVHDEPNMTSLMKQRQTEVCTWDGSEESTRFHPPALKAQATPYASLTAASASHLCCPSSIDYPLAMALTSHALDDGNVSPSALSSFGCNFSLPASGVLRPSAAEFNSTWKVQKKVGSGGFALVYQVTRALDKSKYALKVLKVNADGKASGSRVSQFFREARALQGARHRNVVKFNGLIKIPSGTDAFKNTSPLWGLLQELCTGGPISDKIADSMLSSYGKVQIVHRDVKLDNILLQPTSHGLMEAKLSDFGLHEVPKDRKQPTLLVRREIPASLNGSGGGSRSGSTQGLVCARGSQSGSTQGLVGARGSRRGSTQGVVGARGSRSGSCSYEAMDISGLSGTQSMPVSCNVGEDSILHHHSIFCSSTDRVRLRSRMNVGTSGSGELGGELRLMEPLSDSRVPGLRIPLVPTALKSSPSTPLRIPPVPTALRSSPSTTLRIPSVPTALRSSPSTTLRIPLVPTALKGSPGTTLRIPLVPTALKGSPGTTLRSPLVPTALKSSPSTPQGDPSHTSSRPQPPLSTQPPLLCPELIDTLFTPSLPPRQIYSAFDAQSRNALHRVEEDEQIQKASARRTQSSHVLLRSAHTTAPCSSLQPKLQENTSLPEEHSPRSEQPCPLSVFSNINPISESESPPPPNPLYFSGGNLQEGPTHASGGNQSEKKFLMSEVSAMVNTIIQEKEFNLGDYDLAYNLTGDTGSVFYMAPEVRLREPYNEKADVFSFAIRICQGWRPPRVDKIPNEVWDLIEACWAHNPGARPDMHMGADELMEVWDLIEACWVYNPGARPDVHMVADELMELNANSDAIFNIPRRPKNASSTASKYFGDVHYRKSQCLKIPHNLVEVTLPWLCADSCFKYLDNGHHKKFWCFRLLHNLLEVILQGLRADECFECLGNGHYWKYWCFRLLHDLLEVSLQGLRADECFECLGDGHSRRYPCL
eukprot:gene19443-26102_t